MAPGKVSYPSVFVVDSKMRPPPMPPKPGRRQRKEVIQTLLVILVCVALCGMAVEACFIYHLFTSKENTKPPDGPQISMRKQEKEHAVTPKQKLFGDMKPSKPMAQLTTGMKLVNGVLLWDENHQSILYHIKHKADEGKLIIEKEGYYSVYSKIHFMEDNILFSHSVVWVTHRYRGNEILLLQSSKLHPKSRDTDNSYLSGVFHLYKSDAVFVRVNNCTLVLSNAAENYFGVFMI
ncbi:tumor necrosis factor ligand superfamily member 14-like [Carassius carassius]|uniref:tumor necrosis factor ligand superfamily member 14-like n=1 Tax=Carassius carassius TaxID=217509 RepID=UPI002868C517|nr:tumor necrosis factor ligand superfamily member 14-like [Carassius carassius]